MSLLVARLALAIFLLLQFKNFFEWCLGHGSGNFIFPVKVLFFITNIVLV